MAGIQQTPLYETHLAYGGKMVEFGGWLLPVQYSGILEEHRAVRERAGLFDVSHMGEVSVQGAGALDYLNHLVTNDVSRLVVNQVQYSPMCYPTGGTVDDLLIYMYSDTHYLLVINAANIDKDWSWLQESRAGFAVELENCSNQMAQLALQGPAAERILAQLTDLPLAELNYYWFIPEVWIAGKKTLLSRTGYTGEDGFEIYCQPEAAAYLWNELMAAGKAEGLLPAGLGCRDTLRFESCLPLYGHELSEVISPLEAGLARFVKLDKPEFSGKKALADQKIQGLERKVVGLELTERGIARAGYPVIADGRVIGSVTTGSYAPTLGKNVGLALVEARFSQVGQKLAVEIRGKNIAAEVIGKPFYKREEKKL
jgi:aminomethyltransferase